MTSSNCAFLFSSWAFLSLQFFLLSLTLFFFFISLSKPFSVRFTRSVVHLAFAISIGQKKRKKSLLTVGVLCSPVKNWEIKENKTNSAKVNRKPQEKKNSLLLVLATFFYSWWRLKNSFDEMLRNYRRFFIQLEFVYWVFVDFWIEFLLKTLNGVTK